MQKFSNVEEVVNALRPVNPVYCIRPNSIKKAVNFFKNNFSETFYMLLRQIQMNSS